MVKRNFAFLAVLNGQEAPPPQQSENKPPPVPELIFPNLEEWKKNINDRLEKAKKFIVSDKGQYEDQEIIKVKRIAADIMNAIEERLKDKKAMNSKNQRSVANQLAELEEKFSNAGRRLFGIRWNAVPCGAGFVQATCGQLKPCTEWLHLIEDNSNRRTILLFQALELDFYSEFP